MRKSQDSLASALASVPVPASADRRLDRGGAVSLVTRELLKLDLRRAC